jgi:hypothetical protein
MGRELRLLPFFLKLNIKPMTLDEFKEKHRPIDNPFVKGSYEFSPKDPNQLLKALSFPKENTWVKDDESIVPYSGIRYGKALIVTIIPHDYDSVRVEL